MNNKISVTITPEMIQSAETVKCKQCDGEIFIDAVILKKISPLLLPTPNGKPAPLKLKTTLCIKCLIPPSIQDKIEDDAVMPKT